MVYTYRTTTRIYYDYGKRTDLGDGLGLVGLLRVVSSDTLSLDALGLLVNLVVRAEEINLVVVIFLGGGSLRGSSRGTAKEGLASSTGAGKSAELGHIGIDVVVPAGHAGEGCSGGRGDRLEDGDIGLGRGVPMGRCQKKGSKIPWARLKRIRKLGKWLSAYWSSGV